MASLLAVSFMTGSYYHREVTVFTRTIRASNNSRCSFLASKILNNSRCAASIIFFFLIIRDLNFLIITRVPARAKCERSCVGKSCVGGRVVLERAVRVFHVYHAAWTPVLWEKSSQQKESLAIQKIRLQ